MLVEKVNIDNMTIYCITYKFIFSTLREFFFTIYMKKKFCEGEHDTFMK
jgi:hypothetical protein